LLQYVCSSTRERELARASPTQKKERQVSLDCVKFFFVWPEMEKSSPQIFEFFLLLCVASAGKLLCSRLNDDRSKREIGGLLEKRSN
jgi:hypothetical protein